MLDTDVKEPALAITGSLHVKTELVLATTEELLCSTTCFLTLLFTWLFCPNQHPVYGSATVVKARYASLLETFRKNLLFAMVGRE